MALGPKTRRFLALRKNPARVLIGEQLDSLDAVAEVHGRTAANKFLENARVILQKSLDALYARAQEILGALPGMMQENFERMAKERLDSMPHLKGAAGYTPQKGKDYNDGEPGGPGYTPRPDVDYMSKGSAATFLKSSLEVAEKSLIEKIEKRGMSAEAVAKAITEGFKNIDYKKIARGLEALKYADKLDYETGLKNKPGAQVEGKGKILHRGGGASKQTYFYDLSDQCDGGTKVFTIPSNARVISVSGTDAPGGIYRPLVDWTGSGSTQLTLTAQVAAPTQGATLYILYVV